MDDETKNLIKEQYAKLPRALQQAIRSSNLHDRIEVIGSKNQLHIDQIGELEEEVTMLMMGFIDPIEFVGVLQEHVHVDPSTAQKIATDVNQEILLPIRDRLESSTEEAEMPEEQKGSSAADMPPMTEKSVVMPSAKGVSVAAAIINPAPTVTMLATTTAPQSGVSKGTLTSPGDAVPLDMQIEPPMHEADIMLTEPTISLPKKVEPAVPQSGVSKDTLTSPSDAGPLPAASTSPTEGKVETLLPPIYKADPYREPID